MWKALFCLVMAGWLCSGGNALAQNRQPAKQGRASAVSEPAGKKAAVKPAAARSVSSAKVTATEPENAVSVLVFKGDRKLMIMRGAQVLQEFNVCLGDEPVGHKGCEGDERTPEGIYKLDYKNPHSSYYKSMRIDYPHAADREAAKKRGCPPGGQIFVHGCGRMDLRALQKLGTDWTDGCIALTDKEMDIFWDTVPVGATIDIRP